MTLAAAMLLLAALAETDASAQLEEADRHFAQRGLGAQGPKCDPAEIEEALRLYRKARQLDPASIPGRIGMLRSLFFRGGFCGERGEAQKRTFEEAKRLAEDSEAQLERDAGAKLRRDKPAPFRSVRDAPALFFWCGVAWGQWALDHKVPAAWQGAAGKIRDLGETALLLDGAYEQGSPHLLLGRLHADSPKIPLITGFVSRRKALEHLRRAHEIAPANSIAAWFLAKAILEHEPQSRPQALALLRTCAAGEPRADYLVEDRHYAALARARLRQLGETR